MTLRELTDRIEEKTAVLGVIGLGYVGLPVAAIFAEAGYQVIGVDVKADRVETINAGSSPIEGNEPGLPNLDNMSKFYIKPVQIFDILR